MKQIWINIEVGTPRFEDGVVSTRLYVDDDGIRTIDEILDSIFHQNYFQYIVSFDGVPFKWNLYATGSVWSLL